MSAEDFRGCRFVFIISGHQGRTSETKFSFLGVRQDFGCSRFNQADVDSVKRLSDTAVDKGVILLARHGKRSAGFGETKSRLELPASGVICKKRVVAVQQIFSDFVSSADRVFDKGAVMLCQKRIHTLIHDRHSGKVCNLFAADNLCAVLRVEPRNKNYPQTCRERHMNNDCKTKSMEDRKNG